MPQLIRGVATDLFGNYAVEFFVGNEGSNRVRFSSMVQAM
jgi:hypothetical protein